MAAELVSRQVAVLAATGGEPSAQAAKAATGTIPIVFTIGSDPVQLGLVASLSKPGANITGVTFILPELGTKRLELLRQLIPKVSAITLLVNPNYPPSSVEIRDVQAGARSLGLQISVLNASIEPEIDTAFKTIAQQKVDALIVGADPFLVGQRDQLVRLAAHYAVPTFFPNREFVEAGGCDARVRFWHLTDVHADRYFGRYRGKNGHTASTREPTLLTLKRHFGRLRLA
jgi:putative ABC transport system substrate-binding protein